MPRPGTSRPPYKRELDWTNIYFVSNGGMGSCPSLLTTIPQEGRNVEIVFVGGG
jgi:hypothetical protein